MQGSAVKEGMGTHGIQSRLVGVVRCGSGGVGRYRFRGRRLDGSFALLCRSMLQHAPSSTGTLRRILGSTVDPTVNSAKSTWAWLPGGSRAGPRNTSAEHCAACAGSQSPRSGLRCVLASVSRAGAAGFRVPNGRGIPIRSVGLPMVKLPPLENCALAQSGDCHPADKMRLGAASG